MGAPSKPASRPAHGTNSPVRRRPRSKVTGEPLALPSGATQGANAQGEAYLGAPPWLPSGNVGSQQRGWQFWVPSTILAMLAVGGLAVGGFFVGEGSGPSNGQIASKLSAAVSHQKAVDATAKTQALTKQRAEMRRLFVRRGKRLASRAYKKGYQIVDSTAIRPGRAPAMPLGKTPATSPARWTARPRATRTANSTGSSRGSTLPRPSRSVVNGHLICLPRPTGAGERRPDRGRRDCHR